MQKNVTLQIHDELVFESSLQNQKDNEKQISEVMSSYRLLNIICFSIPLEVV